MRMIVAAVVLATAVTSTAAFAADVRLTDAQFIKLGSCRALPDAARYDAIHKANVRGRATHVVDRADEARRDARREVGKGNAEAVAKITEACASFD